jgi:hypothetical protein
MSEPTLMNPNPEPSESAAPPASFDPTKMRVVDVERQSPEAVERFDCYQSEEEEKMFRLVGDEVEVRAVDWARSKEMEAEPEVRWTGTGLSFWEVDRIRVFSWPRGMLIRIYREVS